MGTIKAFSSLWNKNGHPLIDILNRKLPVYGDEADELIRRVCILSSGREAIEWWEKKIGWMTDPAAALFHAKIRYEEVLKREELSGWEFSE